MSIVVRLNRCNDDIVIRKRSHQPIAIPPMRKIEQMMNRAINDCIDWKNDNTKVTYSPERDASYVYLFDNHIATIGDTWIELYNCGYKTATTKSRLNAILSAHGNGERVYQKDFDWFVSTNQGTVPFTEGMVLN